MKQVSIALDWSPNTNHTGFYVARNQRYYRDLGLDVTIISPHSDEYKRTPASRVVDGSAQFACTPSESVISYHTWPGAAKPKIVAVATLLQDSTSAIVTLKSSGIDRPAKLDGKVYASYAARYEGRIVQQMIKNDGGKGDYIESTPPMLGIWNTLLKGDADATWIFQGWEGIWAKRVGIELNTFPVEEYKVPYGYSPVLVTHPDTLSQDAALVRDFLSATSKGYAAAAANPGWAADILFEEVAKDTAQQPLPEPLDKDMLRESQEYVSKHYLAPSGRWGEMAMPTWEAFLDWLHQTGLLTTKVQSRDAAAADSSEPATTSDTTSLDGLRAGDVGELLPRDAVKAEDLATNSFLPASAP